MVASRVLLAAKRRRFYERPKSKQRKREDAIRRSEYRKEIDKLRKLGKFEENTRERF